MRINPEWRIVWKHISTQCMAIFIIAVGLWNNLPDAFRNAFSETELKWYSVILIAVGFIGKFVDQGLSNEKPNDD